MIEFRWRVDVWEEWRPGMQTPIKHRENPVLQFREEEGPRGERWWGDWKDVPTVYVGE